MLRACRIHRCWTSYPRICKTAHYNNGSSRRSACRRIFSGVCPVLLAADRWRLHHDTILGNSRSSDNCACPKKKRHKNINLSVMSSKIAFWMLNLINALNKLISFSSLDPRTSNCLVFNVVISACVVLTWISFGRRSSWRSRQTPSQLHSWGFGGGCGGCGGCGGAPDAGSSMLSNALRASSWNWCDSWIWLCLYPCVAMMAAATKQTNKYDFILALKEVSSENSVWNSTCTLNEDRWVKTFYTTKAENQTLGLFAVCFWFVALRILIGWIMHV